MVDFSKITGFEWDKGNVDKSYQKHGITPNEAEEIFFDEDQLVFEDKKHSLKERRFDIIGKSTKSNILFIAFTIRRNKVRIISARKASFKERKKYEEKI